MAKILFSQYHKEDLKSLAERLKKDYYDQIIDSCINISRQASILKTTTESTNSQALYYSLCIKLTEEIREEIRVYQTEIVPYIHELYEKKETNHDCSGCAGSCKLNHNIKLTAIKSAHQKIKEIIYRINQLDKSADIEVCENNPGCKVLHNEIQQLDVMITELFYLEEAILIPKIQEAQSNINALS